MEDAMDADPFLDDSEEPLFADDLDEDDDIPAPPSPVNQEEIRRRARLKAANNSSRTVNNSLAFSSGSPSRLDGQGGETTTAVVDPDGAEQPVPIKKRKPILTLGPDRLTGERGFKVLKDEFPLIKFQGKGHEASDLKVLLSRYEHWAHRLFPKLAFQDMLERIEKLAGDKEVKHCLSQMRVGREFQTTVDSSEEEDEEVGGERESISGGGVQQARNTAADNAAGVCPPLNDEIEAGSPVSDLNTHGQLGEDITPAAQAPVTRVSPDSDSDDEWNMLGRRQMSSKNQQHSPHKDGPAQKQVTRVSPDVDSDSDDEWNMLGQKKMSCKDQCLPQSNKLIEATDTETLDAVAEQTQDTVDSGMEEGCDVLDGARRDGTLKEGERCDTDGVIPLTSQNILGERQGELQIDDVACCDSVTQCSDGRATSREEATFHSHPLAEGDVSSSKGSGEQEAMDIDVLQHTTATEGSSETDPALQPPLAAEGSSETVTALQLTLAAEGSSGEKPTEFISQQDTELGQKELDDFFAEF